MRMWDAGEMMPAMGRESTPLLSLGGGGGVHETMARVPAEAAEVHSTIKPGVRFIDVGELWIRQ